MMLVISVIVAVAILGMLLGFLGNIGGFGAKAKDVIPDLVKKIQQKGFGLENKDSVEFNKDDRIYQQDAIGTSSVDEKNILFVCASDSICSDGTDTPLTVTDTKIVCNRKISVTVAVCYNGNHDNLYRIVIGGSTASDSAASKAETECGLSG